MIFTQSKSCLAPFVIILIYAGSTLGQEPVDTKTNPPQNTVKPKHTGGSLKVPGKTVPIDNQLVLDSMAQSFRDTNKELKRVGSELDTANNQIKELQSQLIERNITIANIRSDLTAKDRALSNATRELITSTALLADSNMKLDDLNRSKREIDAAKSEVEKELKEKKYQIYRLNETHIKAKEKYEQSEHVNKEAAGKELKAAEDKLEAANADKNKLEIELITKNKSLTEVITKRDKININLVGIKKTNNDLKADMEKTSLLLDNIMTTILVIFLAICLLGIVVAFFVVRNRQKAMIDHAEWDPEDDTNKNPLKKATYEQFVRYRIILQSAPIVVTTLASLMGLCMIVTTAIIICYTDQGGTAVKKLMESAGWGVLTALISPMVGIITVYGIVDGRFQGLLKFMQEMEYLKPSEK